MADLSENLQSLLALNRNLGQLESSGCFTLNQEEARRKLSVHAQANSRLWTLKLIQGFNELGCTCLRVTVSRHSWGIRAQGAVRPLNLQELQRCLGRAGLTARPGGEGYLAMAMVGLTSWSLYSVSYQGQGIEVSNLLVEGSALQFRPSYSDDISLQFHFSGPRAPNFPVSLWRTSLLYSPMRIEFQGKELLPQVTGQSEPYLMEAVSHHQGPELGLNTPPGGGAEMARPSKSFGNHNNLSRWRWSDPTQSEVASDLIVRLRPHLKGPTCFYPVVAGVPMQPLHLKDCPPGLDIAFIADDWPLDFSQFSLRESPQLQAHLHQLAGRSGTLLGNFHQGPANIMLAGQRPGRSYVCDLVIILLGCASIVYGLLPVDDWDRHVPNICLLPIIVCPLYFLNEPRSRRATFAQNRAEWAAAVQETVLALKRCSGMTLPPKSSPPAGKPVIPA